MTMPARKNLIVAPLALAAITLGGCAAPYLSRVDTTGRAPDLVEADKLACSHEAQQPMTWGQFAAGLALGPVGGALYEGRNAEVRERQRRIEQLGEACMLKRGYTLRGSP
jgi:hypothetical protein